MKRRCIIHFGMHKTGSSSIQQSLFRYAPNLPNWHYLQVGSANLSGAIATAFGNNPTQYHANRKRGLTEPEVITRIPEIKTRLTTQFKESSKPDFLLSGEDISIIGHQGLLRLVDWLVGQVDEIQAVGYIRAPRSFMASKFQQRVKGGLNQLIINNLCPCYRDRFEIFDQILGRDQVQFWKFDPVSFPDRCVVQDFCGRLGIDLPETQIIRVNEGLSREAIALLYAYRKYGPGYGVGSTVMKENNRLIAVLARLSGHKLQFSAQAVQPVLEMRREQIAWMEDRLGASLQEAPTDDSQAIHEETDLLKFSPESVCWLKDQLGLDAIDLSSPSPETIAQWMHLLRLKLIQENRPAPRKIKSLHLFQEPEATLKRNAMKTLYLHIGTEKTGTTTLQRFLSKNRTTLARQGIAYLKSPGLLNHSKLATCCMDDTHIDGVIRNANLIEPAKRKEWRTGFIKAFHDEMEDLKSWATTVIISSEHFYSRLLNLSEIERLHQLLCSFFNYIKVIVYLRRQDELAIGRYSTKLKCGAIPSEVFPVKQAASHYYDYRLLLNHWSNVFGKEAILPRIYDRIRLIEGSIINDFAAQIEVDTTALFIPRDENLTLSADALEVLQILNHQIIQNVLPRQTVATLRRRIIQFLESRHSKAFQPARPEALAFYELFKQSNAAVASEWFAREPLFSDDFSQYPEVAPTVAIDSTAVAGILASAITRLKKHEESQINLTSITHQDEIPELAQLAKLMDNQSSQISKAFAISSSNNELDNEMTNKPTLHIHIGNGKTGTTAIQKALQDNSGFLKKESLFYLGMCFEYLEKRQFSWNIKSGSDKFFSLSVVDAKTQLMTTLDDAFLEAQQQSLKQLIWSNEWLFRRPKHVVKALEKFCNQCNLHIIIYLRRQDRWLLSAYKQWGIKHKTYPGVILSFHQWYEQRFGKEQLDYFGILNYWKNALPQAKFSIRIYEKCADVCEDFFNIIGIPYTDLPNQVGRIYETPNDWILSYYALFNGLFNEPVHSRELEALLRRSGLLELQTPSKIIDFDLPNESFLAQVLAQCQESNARLAETFSTPDYAVVFDDAPVVAAKPMQMADPHSLIAGLLLMVQRLDSEVRELRTQVRELRKSVHPPVPPTSSPDIDQIQVAHSEASHNHAD